MPGLSSGAASQTRTSRSPVAVAGCKSRIEVQWPAAACKQAPQELHQSVSAWGQQTSGKPRLQNASPCQQMSPILAAVALQAAHAPDTPLNEHGMCMRASDVFVLTGSRAGPICLRHHIRCMLMTFKRWTCSCTGHLGSPGKAGSCAVLHSRRQILNISCPSQISPPKEEKPNRGDLQPKSPTPSPKFPRRTENNARVSHHGPSGAGSQLVQAAPESPPLAPVQQGRGAAIHKGLAIQARSLQGLQRQLHDVPLVHIHLFASSICYLGHEGDIEK